MPFYSDTTESGELDALNILLKEEREEEKERERETKRERESQRAREPDRVPS